MAPILATLLIGLVTKFGGDMIIDKAKKFFAENAAKTASGAPATSFASSLADARAEQGEAAPPAASSATTNFAALPAAADGVAAEPKAASTAPRDAAAVYAWLDSIQTS